MLKELDAICTNQLRPYDILGCLGGEEFAITLIACDLRGALDVMERLRKAIEKHVFVVDEGRKIHVEISGGITQIDDASEDIEAELRRADQALYAAKDAGRNRIEIFLHPRAMVNDP